LASPSISAGRYPSYRSPACFPEYCRFGLRRLSPDSFPVLACGSVPLFLSGPLLYIDCPSLPVNIHGMSTLALRCGCPSVACFVGTGVDNYCRIYTVTVCTAPSRPLRSHYAWMSGIVRPLHWLSAGCGTSPLEEAFSLLVANSIAIWFDFCALPIHKWPPQQPTSHGALPTTARSAGQAPSDTALSRPAM